MKTLIKKAGFTLVELAIVMTIIGLLIGGVLKGQELLENSRMTALSRDIKSYQAAITTFRDIYKGVPGDLLTATSYITGCTAGNNCVNGDGSGRIESGDPGQWYHNYDSLECFQAWKHLALAGLVQGVDTSRAHVAANYTGGRDVPTSPFGGQLYIKSTWVNCFSGHGELICGFAANLNGDRAASNTGMVYMFTPSQMLKMDLKIDDGVAFSGDVVSTSNGHTDGCGTAANGTSGYNVNVGGRTCNPGFFLGR